MDIFETFLNWEVLQRAWPMLMKGLWITVQLGAPASWRVLFSAFSWPWSGFMR